MSLGKHLEALEDTAIGDEQIVLLVRAKDARCIAVHIVKRQAVDVGEHLHHTSIDAAESLSLAAIGTLVSLGETGSHSSDSRCRHGRTTLVRGRIVLNLGQI